jgi:pimeloyl-ACP methyl ester carboxylesterase
MPVLRINATTAGLTLHGTTGPASVRFENATAQTGPAIIMLHGYKYAPGVDGRCPHRKIFGHENDNWPAQLGFGDDRGDEGLGIALGWYARGHLRAVHERAARMGASIALIVSLLRGHAPRRPVHIIAHSLGSEAALNALPHLPRGSVDRMVLLTGASYAGRAREMLDTDAGRSAEILNVTSRENDLFDAAFEHLVGSDRRRDRAIGQGIDAPNVASIQIDCPQTLRGLDAMGFPIAPPDRRICHWSSYRRQGVMALYKTFLRAPETLPLEVLAKALPAQIAPRWSRLLSLPQRVRAAREISLPLRPQAFGAP